MRKGETINGRYRLEKQMSSAWLATDLLERQMCVLKPAMTFADSAVVKALGQVWFPGLPRLLDKLIIPEAELLVFNYIDGKTLEESIRSAPGGLPAEQTLAIMLQMAKTLDFLHRQMDRPLMHLDIKPANIVLSETGQAALIDFNSARFFRNTQSGQESRLTCTMDYAAPELLCNKPCPASDIYSLGLCFLQAMSGVNQINHKQQDPDSLYQGIPAAIKNIISHCLCLDPGRRLAEADELARLIALELHRLRDSLILPGSQTLKTEIAQPGPLSQGNLLCVWGNAEFGCELAAFLAEKKETLLIDADLLFPQADMLLGLGQKSRQKSRSSGFDLALRENSDSELTAEELQSSLVPVADSGLYVLYSLRDLHSYEQYRHDSLHRILQISKNKFSLVILLCSSFIYDAFTCLGLFTSDMILVPLSADLSAFRSANRLLGYMIARQICDGDKIRYVAYPYRAKWDLSWGTMDELCGGRFYGCITQSDRRQALKNEKKAYAMHINQQNRQEYKALAQRLGIY